MPKSSAHSNWQTLLTGEYVTYWGLIWSAIALLLYLTFSVVDSGTSRPVWSIAMTTGMREIAVLVAGCLCLRNWQSRSMPNGSYVWLLLAIAIFAFGVGNLWFCLWEILWGLDPAASAGNPWYGIFYLMLLAGVRSIVLDRDIQLTNSQWMVGLSIATCGLIIACWLTTATARAEVPPATPILATSYTLAKGQIAKENRGLGFSLTTPAADRLFQDVSLPQMVAIDLTSKTGKLTAATIAPHVQKSPPEWVGAIDRSLQPLITTFNLFYIIADLVLLIFGTILWLGCWREDWGSPWRTIAQGVLCFYLADTWFAYANNQVQGYESGFIIEVFWILGIVQFGIAAALEFDRSIRPHRLDRRTAIK